MNDEHYTDDDRLDARLRAGLTALVAEAPEPPPLPAPVAGRARHRALVLAGAVVLVAVGAVVATRRDRDQHVTGGAGANAPLIGTRWVLTGIEHDGRPLGIGGLRPIDLRVNRCTPSSATSTADTIVQDCPTGTRIVGSTVCNSFGADVAIAGDRLRIQRGEGTKVRCEGPETTITGVVEATGEVRFSIAGDVLTLERGPTTLTYRAAVPAAAGEALVDTDWTLETATRGNRAIAMPADRDVRLSFARCTGPDCTSPYRMGGSDGCNDFGATVTITSDQIVARDASTTAVGCTDDLSPTVSQVMFMPTIGYARDGDELRLETGSILLLYRRTDQRLPAVEGTVLAEGARGGALWRLSWQRQDGHVAVELVDRERDSTAIGQGGLAADPDEPERLANIQLFPIDAGEYAFGLVSSATVRITAEVDGRQPVDLDLYTLEGVDQLEAFGGFIARGDTTLRAYGASGAEIAHADRRGL